MSKPVIPIEIKAVMPANGGSALFLGNDSKSFVIYIDHFLGNAISMAVRKLSAERPQTHELFAQVLKGLGAELDRVVINDQNEGVFYARLIFTMTNEVVQRKVVEIDARPSDSVALAAHLGAPLFVATSVWEEVEDMSDLLKQMQSDSEEPGDPRIPF